MGGPIGESCGGACQHIPRLTKESTRIEAIPKAKVSLRNCFIISLVTSWGRLWLKDTTTIFN